MLEVRVMKVFSTRLARPAAEVRFRRSVAESTTSSTSPSELAVVLVEVRVTIADGTARLWLWMVIPLAHFTVCYNYTQFQLPTDEQHGCWSYIKHYYSGDE